MVLYTYFIAALLGRQMIPKVDGAPPSGKYEDPDLYFPLFTALQVSKKFFVSKIFLKSRSESEAHAHTIENERIFYFY